MERIICDDCKGVFKSERRRVQWAYCRKCRRIRRDDLVEVIYRGENGVSIKRFSDDEGDAAEEFLGGLPRVSLALDLQNVLDTVPWDVNVNLCNLMDTCVKGVCAVSFVSHLKVTRTKACDEIKRRIESGQIEFGVLVFERGERVDEWSKVREVYLGVGGKAWVISCLSDVCVFVDDSKDHILSVKEKAKSAGRRMVCDYLSADCDGEYRYNPMNGSKVGRCCSMCENWKWSRHIRVYHEGGADDEMKEELLNSMDIIIHKLEHAEASKWDEETIEGKMRERALVKEAEKEAKRVIATTFGERKEEKEEGEECVEGYVLTSFDMNEIMKNVEGGFWGGQ